MAEQKRHRLDETARDLGLSYGSWHPDWGIMDADHMRLPEFVAYYREHSAGFDDARLDSVGELLLASVNGAVVEGHPHAALLPTVFELLWADRHHDVTRWRLEYWSGFYLNEGAIGAEEVFPISRPLEQLISARSRRR